MDVSSKYMHCSPPSLSLASSFEQYKREKTDISVVALVGSLKHHSDFWDHLPVSNYIKKIVAHGYTIPLKWLPKPICLQNNVSSRNESTFVRQSIDKLVLKNAVMQVQTPPRVVNPLTVAIKDGKKRLVLDLQHMNKAVLQQKCKIEAAETLAQYLPSSKFLYGFDWKSGYHHMDIVNTQWCLLGFSYTDHLGNTRFFVFRVLPFGLSSAGFVFTKLLRVLIHYWRTKGIRIVVFFDDGIGAVLDYHKGLAERKIVKSTLLKAGFIPNVSKSSWIPVQTLAWLGFCYDLIKRLIYAQTQKLDKIKTLIVSHRKSKFIHKRTLSSIVGSIVALHLSHGDIVYLRTKRMQMQIAKDTRWDIYIRPNDFTRDELNFWLNYMYDNNGLSVDSPTAAAAVSYSDASATGCASIIPPIALHHQLVR